MARLSVLPVAVTIMLCAQPLWGGSYQYGNQLFIRDIIPGTEQVRLIPGGDFEEGPAPLWSLPCRTYHWPDGGPHIAVRPGVCGARSWNVAGDEKHDIRREPRRDFDWMIYFSGYGWLPSAGRLRTGGIAPGNRGEQHICVDWPVAGGDCEAMAEGFYLFGDVRPGHCNSVWVPNWNTKGGVDAKLEKNQHSYGFWDAKDRWMPVNMGGDNYADTPAVDFAPPVTRAEAAWDFADYLLAEPRAKALVKSRDFDAAAAVAELAKAAAADPRDARAQNALAAACIVKFARNLDDFDACKQALAAWRASLEIQPDQPLVRYWLRQYGGYLPPRKFEAPKSPPPEAVAAAEKALAEMDRTQRQCSILLMRDIVPGTERVRRAPGGDFEKGLNGWTAPPEHPGFGAGAPESLRPARNPLHPWRGEFLYVQAPLPEGKTAELLSQPMSLPAGQYVVSAYIAPSVDGFSIAGAADSRSVISYITIGLEGESQALFWGMTDKFPWRINEGLFVFVTIRLDKPVADKRLRIATGPWYSTGQASKTPPHPALRDAAGNDRQVAMLIDDVAITPAAEFRPPAVRTAAQLAMLQWLALEGQTAQSRPAGSAPAATPADLAARDRQGDLPKAIAMLGQGAASAPSPAAWNRLAAAEMAQFLRDLAGKDHFDAAIKAWDASLAIDGDQPQVRMWRDILGGYQPVAGAVRQEFEFRQPYLATMFPGGGTVAAGQSVSVSIEPQSLAPILDPFEIRYTTDGKQPDKSSAKYQGPIAVERDVTLKAVCLSEGRISPTVTAEFKFAAPAAPTDAQGLQPGLAYLYNEGVWWETFQNRVKTGQDPSPKAAGVVDGFDLSPRRRDVAFGFIFEGFIDVPADGTYTFHTELDGALKLWVGQTEVVDHDPSDGRRAAGVVALAKGKHPIRLACAYGVGEPALSVQWEGPALKRQAIPKESLWHGGSAQSKPAGKKPTAP